jgi:hypothetical protein
MVPGSSETKRDVTPHVLASHCQGKSRSDEAAPWKHHNTRIWIRPAVDSWVTSEKNDEKKAAAIVDRKKMTFRVDFGCTLRTGPIPETLRSSPQFRNLAARGYRQKI